MIIKKIELNNFRNYERLSIDFDEKINILYGKNAQGKTNLLEAAFICATSKSHKGSKDKDIIKMGCNEAHICTTTEKNNIEYRIDVHLKSGKSKGIAVNKIPLKKARELFGLIHVIFFSPEDLDIIKRGPEERRKYIDMELCQIDKIYLNDLTLYKKALSQRNKLLKDIYFEQSLIDTLSSWDEKIIYYGKRIIERRKRFIEELKPIVKNNYKNISGNEESLELFYENNVEVNTYQEELKKNRKNDIKKGQTSIGPHRDDLGININEMDVRKYGSQGQQRSCALSLKLSEIEIIEEYTKQKPILLLDDVLSELDSDRQKQLIKSLYDVQTIMTCTGIEEIKEYGLDKGKVFIVDNANITEI